jgi:hypothetical protein
MMQIFVKLATGKTITIDVSPDHTIAHLKFKIFENTGICRRLNLIHLGIQLDDDKTLNQCNILKESTIHEVIRLGGFTKYVFVNRIISDRYCVKPSSSPKTTNQPHVSDYRNVAMTHMNHPNGETYQFNDLIKIYEKVYDTIDKDQIDYCGNGYNSDQFDIHN